mmetsp:Transcript_55111/g.83395  ORF Transcript_55111/g.83395 Transcript_55111/m.83395 type:complete len:124 (-) Transcript_55111:9-380(-)
MTSASLHLLPCEIVHNGEAPVAEYFVQETINEGQVTSLRTHFRGRELLGSKVKLPECTKGFCGTKTGDTIVLTKSFEEFTYWNREVNPSTRDPINNWILWPEIANAIHTTMPTEDELKDENAA